MEMSAPRLGLQEPALVVPQMMPSLAEWWKVPPALWATWVAAASKVPVAL